MLTLWKGARHLDPETWENSAGRPDRGPGLSTATERKTLLQHLQLAVAAMSIPPHLSPQRKLFALQRVACWMKCRLQGLIEFL